MFPTDDSIAIMSEVASFFGKKFVILSVLIRQLLHTSLNLTSTASDDSEFSIFGLLL
jgi:hypothetical protein